MSEELQIEIDKKDEALEAYDRKCKELRTLTQRNEELEKELAQIKNEVRKYFKVRDKWGRDDYMTKRRNDTIYSCMLIRCRRIEKLLKEK